LTALCPAADDELNRGLVNRLTQRRRPCHRRARRRPARHGTLWTPPGLHRAGQGRRSPARPRSFGW